MDNILLFGGTFNPVHKGHTQAVEKICEKFYFEKIIIMPSKIPPHKLAPDLASENDRFEMTRLAFEKFKNAEISDFELKRCDKSYSYYTVKYLKEMYPNHKLFMAVGSDMLLTFDTWFRFEDILKITSLVCVSRETGDMQSLEKKSDELSKFGEIFIVKAPVFEISSTEIRQKIKNNQDTSCYLDENVVKYIKDKKIYSEG